MSRYEARTLAIKFNLLELLHRESFPYLERLSLRTDAEIEVVDYPRESWKFDVPVSLFIQTDVRIPPAISEVCFWVSRFKQIF